MIQDALIARERTRFSKPGSTARNVRSGLIVAESREQIVIRRNVLIQANVEFAFVQLPHWLVHIVISITTLWLERCCPTHMSHVARQLILSGQPAWLKQSSLNVHNLCKN